MQNERALLIIKDNKNVFLQKGNVNKLEKRAFSEKAIFDGFQWRLFPSGERATPASPKAPDLESGAIIKKGTAVVMVLSCTNEAASPGSN